MPILNKDDIDMVSKYNSFVKNYPCASFMQDVNWGNLKKNWKKEYIYLERNKKIYAAMSCLIKKNTIYKVFCDICS